MIDKLKISTTTKLYIFDDRDREVYRLARSGAPTNELLRKFKERLLKTKVVKGNIFLNEGINFIWNCVVNGSCSPPFDNANACIGVGDGTTAEDPTQTGLQGANKYYKGMDTGYPTISGTKVTFRATFGGNEANFHWYEWTVANGCSDTATNLNRKVEDLGVKSSGQTWVLEVELSIS